MLFSIPVTSGKPPDVLLVGGVEACVVSNILLIIGIPQITQLPESTKDFAQVVYEKYMAGRLDAERGRLAHLYKCSLYLRPNMC